MAKVVDTMSQTRRKYTRALPFVKVLDKSKPRINKCDILKKFPEYVTDDIVEILHNILIGKLNVKPNQKKVLAKRKCMNLQTYHRLRTGEISSINRKAVFSELFYL